jgi:cholesterol transport system auxiliary component
MPYKRLFFLVGFGFLLSACAVDPVPEIAYYRMPEIISNQQSSSLTSTLPIVVDTFLADGLHGEQAILYSTKPGGSIRAYHYQLWNDPPVRLLQRRLIKHLRQQKNAVLVTDRLGSSVAALRVSGLIERFERTKVANGGWQAEVALELRVDKVRDQAPLLVKAYSVTVPIEGDSMQATVRAFARGTDQVFVQFAHDFAEVKP